MMAIEVDVVIAPKTCREDLNPDWKTYTQIVPSAGSYTGDYLERTF